MLVRLGSTWNSNTLLVRVHIVSTALKIQFHTIKMHTYLNQRSLLLHEIKWKKSGKTEYIRTNSKYFYRERANWVKGGCLRKAGGKSGWAGHKAEGGLLQSSQCFPSGPGQQLHRWEHSVKIHQSVYSIRAFSYVLILQHEGKKKRKYQCQ